MATRLVDTLEKLCKEVLDSDLPPKINIQLFIDVKETVEDLRKVASKDSNLERELIDRSIGSKMRLLSTNSCLAFSWGTALFRSTLSKGLMVLVMP